MVGSEKIKILHNKKPVPTSKRTIADAVEDVGPEVEFGVMVMGGAKDPVSQTPTPVAGTPTVATAAAPDPMQGVEKVASPPTQQQQQQLPTAPAPDQPRSAEILAKKEFWDDLQGFLEQRFKDEGEAGRLRGVFEGAWKAAGGQ